MVPEPPCADCLYQWRCRRRGRILKWSRELSDFLVAVTRALAEGAKEIVGCYEGAAVRGGGRDGSRGTDVEFDAGVRLEFGGCVVVIIHFTFCGGVYFDTIWRLWPVCWLNAGVENFTLLCSLYKKVDYDKVQSTINTLI